MVAAELIDDIRVAETLSDEWDALAVANGEPTAAPAWMLAWWRHIAPPSAELRIVAVRDAARLIGVVPLYVNPASGAGARDYRLLAHDLSSSVTPVALPGATDEVAAAAADLLATRELRPDRLELAPLPADSPWTLALRERWPARMRPLVHRPEVHAAPIVSLDGGGFAGWLGARGSRFRANVRRYQRLFADAGGTYRHADAATVSADVRRFAALHAARWEGRPSVLAALGERLPAFLEDAGQRLVATERFRLTMLELDGDPICADLWLAAGGQLTGVNIGWDERFKQLSPPRLAFVRTVEDAAARGESQLNLGWGRVDYKQGYANGADAVARDVLLPPGARLPRALARAVPGAIRRGVRALAPRRRSDR